MDDLISRHAAIDALMEIMDRPNHAEFLYTDEICKTLNDLPSAQPEIVRCKDCKHWDDVSITEKGHECNLTNGNKYKIRIATPSDWFCPMGERRSE